MPGRRRGQMTYNLARHIEPHGVGPLLPPRHVINPPRPGPIARVVL
jgi:hypothetical protein